MTESGAYLVGRIVGTIRPFLPDENLGEMVQIDPDAILCFDPISHFRSLFCRPRETQHGWTSPLVRLKILYPSSGVTAKPRFSFQMVCREHPARSAKSLSDMLFFRRYFSILEDSFFPMKSIIKYFPFTVKNKKCILMLWTF